jgi:predicted dehydrogenase
MKHKIAFWSYSKHLQNRIIPSIKNNKKIVPIAIFSKKTNLIKKNKYLQKTIIFSNKKKFLLNTSYKTVYISSITGNHYKNCIDALNYNKNIICEKPMGLNPKQVKNIYKLAKIKKLYVHEIFQYSFHPLFLKIKDILKSNILGNLINIESKYTVPINDKKSFRFNKSLGGGSLYDIGIYPLSLNIFLFNNFNPKIIKRNIVFSKRYKIDLMGSITTIYKKAAFKQEWGFNMVYQNYLKITGLKGEMKTDFIFSKKNIDTAVITIKNKTNIKKILINKANQINLAFMYYLNKKNTIIAKNKNIKLSEFINKVLISKKN